MSFDRSNVLLIILKIKFTIIYRQSIRLFNKELINSTQLSFDQFHAIMNHFKQEINE